MSRIGTCVHGVALNTWCERCPSGKRCQITVSGSTANLALQAEQATQTTDEPRAIIRHFAAAMERKLAANDDRKGTWRQSGTFHLLGAMHQEVNEFVDELNMLVNLEDDGAPDDLL